VHCTIVEKQRIYKWILSAFSFEYALVLVRPRRTDAKNDIECYQGQTTFRENAIRKIHKFLL
jgi:hypothetical protein